MYQFNEQEEEFIQTLEKAKMYIKGVLELNNFDGAWYVMDYREDLGSSFNLDREPYNKPVITKKEAWNKGIDIEQCCNYCNAYIVG